MRILFIRHGQTPANVEGRLSTRAPGPGLTDLGHEQAVAVAEALADEPIAAIYASTLQRTQLTAAPLGETKNLPVTVLEGMQEVEAGALEDQSSREAVHAYYETISAWGQGDWSTSMPGGHDAHHFFARFDAGVAQAYAEHPEATVAIINHGVGIRVWLAGRAANVTAEFASARELHNTGVIVASGSPAAGWYVESWQGEPLGGAGVDDPGAADPTGGEIGNESE